MSKTAISWADETLNPFVGCTPVSEGCANCYAAEVAGQTKLQQFEQYQNVLVKPGIWNGNVNFVPSVLDKLVRMKNSRTIFMPSMSDPFHPKVKEEWLDQIFAAIALVPHIKVMMLTKRADRMLEYFSRMETEAKFRQFLQDQAQFWGRKYKLLPKWYSEPNFCNNPEETAITCVYDQLTLHCNDDGFPNLMLGVSVENQATADERIPLLLDTPAAYRFVSYEPALGDISWALTNFPHPFLKYQRDNCDNGGTCFFPIDKCPVCKKDGEPRGNIIDLIIMGGESGNNARPFDCQWARNTAHECRSAGIQFHLKQLGSNPIDNGQAINAGFKGQNVEKWPEDLRRYH